MNVCTCNVPDTRVSHMQGRHVCDRCGGFACGYANPGRALCPRARCDCFIDEYPDSPMCLHPEAFRVIPSDGDRQ